MSEPQIHARGADRIDSLESFDIAGSTQWALLRAHMPHYEEPIRFREAVLHS